MGRAMKRSASSFFGCSERSHQQQSGPNVHQKAEPQQDSQDASSPKYPGPVCALKPPTAVRPRDEGSMASLLPRVDAALTNRHETDTISLKGVRANSNTSEEIVKQALAVRKSRKVKSMVEIRAGANASGIYGKAEEDARRKRLCEERKRSDTRRLAEAARDGDDLAKILTASREARTRELEEPRFESSPKARSGACQTLRKGLRRMSSGVLQHFRRSNR
ncbi:MAG: hypothetical protein M1828_006620 [Chrysothrix sp. TS-e1954]|nr:MAG: hypothetical protein M1828_006620 [Chrysothrix sp. TS-e1954]